MIKHVVTLAAIAVAIAYGTSVIDRKSARTDGPAAPAGEVRAMHTGSGRVVAISAGPTGQFEAAGLINGVYVNLLADTGATVVALTPDDARRAGIDPDRLTYDVPVRTANGTVMNARVTLDEVDVGGIVVRNVEAVVAPPGVLAFSLLGMSYIGALTRFELRGDQLVLVE